MARLLALTLLLAGCSGVGNSNDCKPACSGGQICCLEPNHNAHFPDGGSVVASEPRCVTPSGPVCPTLP